MLDPSGLRGDKKGGDGGKKGDGGGNPGFNLPSDGLFFDLDPKAPGLPFDGWDSEPNSSKVADKVEKNADKTNNVIFTDHGDPGVFNFGETNDEDRNGIYSDDIDRYARERDNGLLGDPLTEWEREKRQHVRDFGRALDSLKPGTNVYLLMCNVGVGSKGKEMEDALNKAWPNLKFHIMNTFCRPPTRGPGGEVEVDPLPPGETQPVDVIGED